MLGGDIRELDLAHVEEQSPHRAEPHVSVGFTEEELFAVQVSSVCQVVAEVQNYAEEGFLPLYMAIELPQDLAQPGAARPGRAKYPHDVLRVDVARANPEERALMDRGLLVI